MQITEIPNTPWRDALMPASFRNVQFHVDSGTRANGRRIVQHQFPKRDAPYAEDMGRTAYEFSIKAYIVAYPFDTDTPLYQRDYRTGRDLLMEQLEIYGPGVLQLPTLQPMWVVAESYKLTEERGTGGYCTFDITFMEAGIQHPAQANLRDKVRATTKKMETITVQLVNGQRTNWVIQIPQPNDTIPPLFNP